MQQGCSHLHSLNSFCIHLYRVCSTFHSPQAKIYTIHVGQLTFFSLAFNSQNIHTEDRSWDTGGNSSNI